MPDDNSLETYIKHLQARKETIQSVNPKSYQIASIDKSIEWCNKLLKE